MTRNSIAAAILAGAVALSPAPCRAYDSLTLFATAVAGVILTPPGFSSTLLIYSIPASYGPRHSYSSYGGYANVGAPAARPQGASRGSPAYANAQTSRNAEITNSVPSIYKGDGCEWTKQNGRTVRVCVPLE